MMTSSGLMDLSLELIVVGLSAFLGTGLNKTFPATLVALSLLVAIIGNSKSHPIRSLLAIATLVLGTAMSLLPASLDAAQSTALGLVLSLLGSLSVNIPALLFVFSGLHSPLSFPLIWATGWSVLSRAGALGRSLTWTPQNSIIAWILPLLGPEVIDFVVAAVATVVAFLSGELSSFRPHLKSFRRRIILCSALGFLLLILPATLKVSQSVATPEQSHVIEVACVRPRGETPGLAEYVTETDMLAGRGSKILLWPESSLRIASKTDLVELITSVSSVARTRHVLVGAAVSGPWDLLAPLEEPSVKPSAPGKLAQALLLFSPANGKLALTYLKRALVPIAETSSFLPGTGPIPSLAISLPIPPSRRPPGHPKTVNITIIPSICLDASFPSLLLPAIASAPSSHQPILLNPASLWHAAAAEDRLATLASLSRSASVPAFTCDINPYGISAVIDRNGEFLAKTRIGGSLETDLPMPVAGLSIYATWLGSVGSLTVLFSLSLISAGAVKAAKAWAEKWRKQVPTAVLVEVADGDDGDGARELENGFADDEDELLHEQPAGSAKSVREGLRNAWKGVVSVANNLQGQVRGRRGGPAAGTAPELGADRPLIDVGE